MSAQQRGRDNLDGFIDGLVRIGTRELVSALGVPEGAAERAMREVADAVCFEFERTYIYVPIAYSQRNREIWDRYHQASGGARACSPERVDQLAAEYGKTSRWIYAILKAMRQADLQARQGVLPGFDPATDPQPQQPAEQPS